MLVASPHSQHNGVEIEGACGGELSCSTCHVLLEEDVYEELGEVGEEEEDMLDLAYGFEEVSLRRLFLGLPSDFARVSC